MALQAPELRDLYDLKVFVVSASLSAAYGNVDKDETTQLTRQNCDSDLMLARRIKRDVKERGRDVDGVLDQVTY
jgi:uridine kinase